jgi:glycosyltransferase involved in cell wall biosynthesis
MTLLAEGLAERGMRVGHIVYPLQRRRPAAEPAPELVERPPYEGSGARARLAETRHIWRSLKEADAAVYLFRGGGPQLAIGSAFCRLHGRRLVFSSAIDLDFDFEREDRTRAHLVPYRAALRHADLTVVQSREQVVLADEAGLEPVVRIPSFAEPAEPAAGPADAFLWVGRLVAYKGPLDYVRLAESLPEARFRMVCAFLPESDADRAIQAELEAADRRLDNFELLDQLPRTEVLELIGRSVALVSTSRSEGMPNVFLEAWARAVPVLSLEYDPDGRIAEHGLGIAAGGSAERFAEGAAELWRDRERRDEMGESGRRFVIEQHGLDAVADRWAEELRPLLPGARP